MDFIANLSKAPDRRSCSPSDRSGSLRNLFRKACENGSDSINLEQFQKIVESKNPFFVERVFTLYDVDSSGTLSMEEFMTALSEIMEMCPEEKLELLFRIYDLDGDNFISLEELHHVIACCMRENGMSFTADNIEHLTLTLFEDADRDGTGTISLQELQALFYRNNGLLENISVSMERWLLPPAPKEKRTPPPQTSFRRKLNFVYIANNSISFAFFVVFLAIQVALIVIRWRQYHGSTYFVIFARASGQCLNFLCAFTLMLMLRKSITVLRTLGVAEYLPLDQHIYYHKLAGWFILTHSILHTIMHCFNFHELSQLTRAPYLEFLFSNHLGIGWIDGDAPVTGWAMLLVLFVMMLSSLPFVRRSGNFEVFYYCHLLYVVFYALLIVHARNFWRWLLIPGLIYAVEVLIRIKCSFGSHGYTYIQQGSILPSRVVHLVIKRPPNFDFRPGDWVFVQIPEIAKAEWHPFTISSAPEMSDVVWLHIRAVGEWTNRVLEYFREQEKRVQKRHQRQCVRGANFSSSMVTDACQMVDLSQGFSLSALHGEPSITPIQPGTRMERLFGVKNFVSTATLKDRLASQKNLREVSVLDQDELSQVPLQRKISTPLSKIKEGENVQLVRRASTLNERRRGLARGKSKVYLLPRPDDCDDNGCRRTSRSRGDDVEDPKLDSRGHVKAVGELSSILSIKRKEPRKEAERGILVKLDRPLHLHMDGPYGSASSHIFSTQHAVLVAAGIGVTPFASILQSIMYRYINAKHNCPQCNHSWSDPDPPIMMHLKKVDFVWITRDQKSFEWFVNLLSELEITQAQLHEANRFLDIHMYVTSALDKSDMKTLGVQLALDLMHEKEKRDLITGLKTRTQPGRPEWNEFFTNIAAQNKGSVTVFCCGPPELGRTLHSHCIPFGFGFKKENF